MAIQCCKLQRTAQVHFRGPSNILEELGSFPNVSLHCLRKIVFLYGCFRCRGERLLETYKIEQVTGSTVLKTYI